MTHNVVLLVLAQIANLTTNLIYLEKPHTRYWLSSGCPATRSEVCRLCCPFLFSSIALLVWVWRYMFRFANKGTAGVNSLLAAYPPLPNDKTIKRQDWQESYVVLLSHCHSASNVYSDYAARGFTSDHSQHCEASPTVTAVVLLLLAFSLGV